MLTADEMPDDNRDLASLEVVLAALPDDAAASCPVGIEDLLRYLADEVPADLTPSDLTFRRTAVIGDRSYWVWSFVEPDGGSPAYATVSIGPAGAATLSYETDHYGLSPEQYVLGDHHQVF
jgi:hypothetical protein